MSRGGGGQGGGGQSGMSVQEMRKVMTGFNHQMKDGVSDATGRRMQQQLNDVGESSARRGGNRSRGRDDYEEEYYEEDSSVSTPATLRLLVGG